MEEKRKIVGLDNPTFRGRLKTYQPRQTYIAQRAKPTYSRTMTELVASAPPALVFTDEDDIEKLSSKPAHQPEPIVTEPNSKIKRASTRQPSSVSVMVSPLVEIVTVEDENSHHFQPKPAKKWHLPQLSWRRTALPALAVALFMIGLGVSLIALRTNHQVTATVHAMSGGQTEHTDENPDEAEPSSEDITKYSVAPDLPRYIRIPKLSVNARVMRMGVKSNGELKSPSNIFDVGWYENSNKPRDPGGAALFDAHVSGPTRRGVFYNLKQLAAGDTIEVEQGDGQKFTYTVVKSQTYDKDKVDMAAALISAVPGKAGLNLMTCTGALQGTDYQQRLVVFAVRQ